MLVSRGEGDTIIVRPLIPLTHKFVSHQLFENSKMFLNALVTK